MKKESRRKKVSYQYKEMLQEERDSNDEISSEDAN